METLIAGRNPEGNMGLCLCENHHVRNTARDAEWTREFSFHPDIGEVYSLYHDWLQAEKHLNAIGGRRTINYKNSPFADATRQHCVMAERGERYIAGDENIDQYYLDKMTDKATRYNAEHQTVKPIMKPHPDYNPARRKRWYDGLFEKDENI